MRWLEGNIRFSCFSNPSIARGNAKFLSISSKYNKFIYTSSVTKDGLAFNFPYNGPQLPMPMHTSPSVSNETTGNPSSTTTTKFDEQSYASYYY